MSESTDTRLARLETRLESLTDKLCSMDEKLDDVRSNQLPAIRSDIASLRTKNSIMASLIGGSAGLLLAAGLELLVKLAR